MTLATKLDIKVGDEARTLKMPYGMLVELLRITGCGDVSQVGLLVTDLYARDLVIRRLLTPDLKEPMTDEKQLIPSFDLEISADTVDAIIAWVLEHLMDHFTRALTVLQTVDATMKARKTA